MPSGHIHEEECPFCHLYVTNMEEHMAFVHKDETVDGLSVSKEFKKQQSHYQEISENNMQINGTYNAHLPENCLNESRNTSMEESFSNLLGESNSFLSILNKECTIKPFNPSFHASEEGGSDDASISVAPHPNDQFQTCVMNLFSNDDIGKICKSEQSLILLGECLYHRLILHGRINSGAETVSHMRLLATIFVEFKKCVVDCTQDIHFMSMFDEDKFPSIQRAVNNIIAEEKFSMKQKFGITLKLVIEMLRENQFLNYKEKLSGCWDDYIKELMSYDCWNYKRKYQDYPSVKGMYLHIIANGSIV